MRLLFITWDGPESTYHESLFIPILAKAREANDSVHLMQFTWNADHRSQSIARAASQQGMFYTTREIQRNNPVVGIPQTLASGIAAIIRYSRDNRIDVLMPRGPLVAAMALGALPFIPASTRLIYDADGLMADERLDFGGWSTWAPPYWTFRALEHCALRRADAVLVRSRSARETLASRAKDADIRQRITIVHNGSNPDVYTPGTQEDRAATRRELSIGANAPLVVYSGSLGGKYRLDTMLRIFARISRRREHAHMLILTRMRHTADHTLKQFGELRNKIRIESADPSAVPRFLATADLGLAIIEPSRSMQAVSPIKIGEYLQCGLPVLATDVGDLSEQLDSQVSHIVRDLNNETAIDSAANWFVDTVLSDREGFRLRSRQRGVTTFSIQRTADGYRQAYSRIVRTT